MPPTPRKRKGIAEAIHEKLKRMPAQTFEEKSYVYRRPTNAAADNTRVVPKTEFVDNTLADRTEARMRAEMPLTADERRYGRRPKGGF